MKTYIVASGDRITASDAVDFVKKMHKQSFSPASNDQEFMAEVANRCLLQNGSIVRSDSPKNFLADLLAAKFITEEEGK